MSFATSVGALSAIAGLAGTATLIWKWGVVRYKKTLGSRRELRDQISLLSCGVTKEYVHQLFGAPVMQFEKGNGLIQDAYWLKHAWVSTLSREKEEAIFAFSITVIDRRFFFPTGRFTNECLDLDVGRSRYAEAAVHPHGWRYKVGATNYEYCEYYYFGRSGHYQIYVISNTDAGLDNSHMGILFQSSPCAVGQEFGAEDIILDINEPPPEPVRTFRERSRPNTFAVLGLQSPSGILRSWDPVGCYHDDISMFPQQPPPAALRVVQEPARAREGH